MMFEAQIDRTRQWWERISPRERTMLTLLGATFLVMVTFITGFLIVDGLSSFEERNAAARQALRDLETKRESYLKAKAMAAQLEARLGKTPVQLQGFLEQVAKESGVAIPESNEQPAQQSGKSAFMERSIELRLQKVTIENLTKFLHGIETGPNLVVVTALNVRTRDDKHEELDVEMTATTYEHAPEKKDKDKEKDKEKDASSSKKKEEL